MEQFVTPPDELARASAINKLRITEEAGVSTTRPRRKWSHLVDRTLTTGGGEQM